MEGFEPTTFGLTGRSYFHTSYIPKLRERESNPRQTAYETVRETNILLTIVGLKGLEPLLLPYQRSRLPLSERPIKKPSFWEGYMIFTNWLFTHNTPIKHSCFIIRHCNIPISSFHFILIVVKDIIIIYDYKI